MERQFIDRIIRRAGSIALAHFGKTTRGTKSGVNDVVTEGDLRVQEYLIAEIMKAYPSCGIVAEESGMDAASEKEDVVYIDPIDGTLNYATGVPIFAVSIAQAHMGVITRATAFLPVTDELAYAELGGGATLNGRPMRVSEKADWESSVGIGTGNIGQREARFWAKVASSTGDQARISVLGSAVAGGIYVADGRRDWYVSHGGKDWDYAGVSLMIREAGGRASDAQGNPWTLGMRELVASNRDLHEPLLAALT